MLSDGRLRSYCPPELVASEVARLAANAAADEFATAHPVLQSAYLLTAVHVAAMGLWAGGLFSLLAVENRRPLVARFGRLAAASVAVLVLSGALLALLHLRSPADLAFTPYGFTLAVKLLAVAAALGGAWFGLRASRTGAPEAVGLGGVLALAALLASLPPPR